MRGFTLNTQHTRPVSQTSWCAPDLWFLAKESALIPPVELGRCLAVAWSDVAVGRVASDSNAKMFSQPASSAVASQCPVQTLIVCTLSMLIRWLCA